MGAVDNQRLSHPVVYVVGTLPPSPGGSPVINANLINAFEPGSIAVALWKSAAFKGKVNITQSWTVSSWTIHPRLDRLTLKAQVPISAWRISQLVRRTSARAIICSYPQAHQLEASLIAAERCNLPLVAYLHDTIAAGGIGTHREDYLSQLEKRVFRESAHIFVMSQGLADLYREKHGRKVDVLPHSFPESRFSEFSPTLQSDSVFWGGAVYSINRSALARLWRGIERHTSLSLNVATRVSRTNLARMGLNGERISTPYYEDRISYLQALESQNILLLALDYPEESPVHVDELSTIFPTKTIEYLASGRPILAHCPRNYFLARFIEENECGVVVSERSETELGLAVKTLSEDVDLQRRCVENSHRAVQQFYTGRVASILRDALEELF